MIADACRAWAELMWNDSPVLPVTQLTLVASHARAGWELSSNSATCRLTVVFLAPTGSEEDVVN